MQIARVKLTGTNPQELNNVSDEIKEIAHKIGVDVSGPIPLPTKKLKVPLIKTPCGDGMHRAGGGANREKWEMRIHKRILNISANDRVMRQITRIRIPPTVNIEIEIRN